MSAGIRHDEGAFAGAGGLEIYWQSWRAEVPVKAVVVIAHGAGEHGGRYRHVVERIVPAGYPVFAHDHRGHGRSEGKRAVIDRMANATADLDAFIARAREAEPAGPLILLGHSMGGCISLDYVLDGSVEARRDRPLGPGGEARAGLGRDAAGQPDALGAGPGPRACSGWIRS